MKKLFLGLGLLALLGGLALAAAFVVLEGRMAATGPAGDEVILTVPRGTTAREIGTQLEEETLIKDKRIWRYFLSRRGAALKLKAGRFKLEHGKTMAELAVVLEGAPLPEDEPFVVVEGWRLRDTDAALAAKGLIKPGAYLAAALNPSKFTAPFALPGKSLEGYLYPETYRIPKQDLDPAMLIQRQLDTFVERVYGPHQGELAGCGRSLHDLVTMASMLEREEPRPEQRPLVAGILWKRIDRKFALGVDATSRYELDEWNDRKRFLERLRDPNDPYNTRLKQGLPPTPIGSPTAASFAAALKPTASEFLYYLHDANKVLHPSRDAAEHEALRKQYDVR